MCLRGSRDVSSNLDGTSWGYLWGIEDEDGNNSLVVGYMSLDLCRRL